MMRLKNRQLQHENTFLLFILRISCAHGWGNTGTAGSAGTILLYFAHYITLHYITLLFSPLPIGALQ
jgi:hypothetical protein